jgi:hypothetical protein
MAALRELAVIGVHPVPVLDDLVDEAVKYRWGCDLCASDLKRARENVLEELESLYLLEIQLDPPDASFDWSEITQPVADRPRSNWQVPYDEQRVEEKSGRWAFFFHFLDLTRPLLTPKGAAPLPPVTPRPTHLSNFIYDLP